MRSHLKKNLSQKRAGGVAQGVDPEFMPKYRKKRKKFIESSWAWRCMLHAGDPSAWEAKAGGVQV
jgi:hypothetical protein